MTALIVEGVPGLRRVLGGLLRDRGMEVSTAGSVAAARGQIGHRPFDAVIVDLVLPDGSGLDVLDTLRGSGSRAHVIVMSDSTADADRIAALSCGADEYVVKPFFCGSSRRVSSRSGGWATQPTTPACASAPWWSTSRPGRHASSMIGDSISRPRSSTSLRTWRRDRATRSARPSSSGRCGVRTPAPARPRSLITSAAFGARSKMTLPIRACCEPFATAGTGWTSPTATILPASRHRVRP